ncbi:family 43 glycosylhydrolase [Zhouia sp. PK063]|uniref:family 43 glycosylhydrolase n=1 Tax=Zhouia sp. PK063 TaxID=3373602 RepID=UPI00379F063C
MRYVFYVLFGLVFLTSCSPSAEEKHIFQQQVIPGELPDPSVIKVDGVYYATGSSNNWGPYFPIYKSSNLQQWQFIGYVFNKAPEWTINSYWAPELYYTNGTFYCYYTARRKDGVSCIGVATTKDITKGFQDHGVIVDWGSEAIDPFVYIEDKTPYITWKAYGLDKDKPIQILGAELSADMLKIKGDAFTLVTAEPNIWEKGGIEGQSIIKHGDDLYMFYSGNACCGGGCDYMVGAARAKSIKGPWEKLESNPILKGNAVWKCTGHGTPVSDGITTYYLYHAYNDKGFPNLGRSALLSEVFWDDKTGWPSFKTSYQDIDSTKIKNDITDHFKGTELQPWWHFDVVNQNYDATIRNNELTLAEKITDSSMITGTGIFVDPEAANFTFQTAVTSKNDALKGLILYVNDANSIGLGGLNDSLQAFKVVNGIKEIIHTQKIDNQSILYLKAVVKNAKQITFSYSTDKQKWFTIKDDTDNEIINGDHLAFWSWGMKVGLFIKSFKTSETHQATFKDFEITYE